MTRRVVDRSDNIQSNGEYQPSLFSLPKPSNFLHLKLTKKKHCSFHGERGPFGFPTMKERECTTDRDYVT